MSEGPERADKVLEPNDPISPTLDREIHHSLEDDSNEGPEQPLLNKNCITAYERNLRDDNYKMTSLGKLRAYWLGIVVCMGGFLCTYL